jgi:branched-subunit amino acid aminotransferase/4-amino-4-deoxychorismate lyase
MNAPLPAGVRAPDRVAWINGRIVRGAAAVLSVFDRGARDGGGIFETLCIHGRRPFAWERHMERLVLSAAELGFPVPPSPAELRAAIDELLEAGSLADAVVRITVTRGIAGGRPTRAGAWAEAEPLAARLWPGTRRGAATAVVSRTPFEPGWLGRHKTTSRMAWDLAREQARAAGADEALLVTPGGAVLEGAASNVFVVRDGEVLTPPLTLDVLPGVTRAIVLELCGELGLRRREAPVDSGLLRGADELFLTNSVQEVLPVASLDGRAFGSLETGLKLRAAYRERVTAGR